jgi:ribosomal protein S27E
MTCPKRSASPSKPATSPTRRNPGIGLGAARVRCCGRFHFREAVASASALKSCPKPVTGQPDTCPRFGRRAYGPRRISRACAGHASCRAGTCAPGPARTDVVPTPGRARRCPNGGCLVTDGGSALARRDSEDCLLSGSRYRRRNPEATVLHELLRDHLEPFLAGQRARGVALPRFVERELRASLDCGDLTRGFLRVHCDGCDDDLLVPFSCKSRAACPSCATRRMEDGAAFLAERVLPDVPYRQRVMSFPRRLRLALALDAALTTRVLAITVRAIFAWQRRRARRVGWRLSRTGAVTFIQRFSSALRLNVHFHRLVSDGVFAPESPPAGGPSFLALPPPCDEEVEAINRKIARKTLLLFRSVDPAARLRRRRPRAALRSCSSAAPASGH